MRALLLLGILLLAIVPAAGGLAPDPTAPCDGFAYRQGVGPSCPVADGYEVLFDDGTRRLTHGLDPVPGHLSWYAFPAEPRAPACVTDPLRERHGLVIYARPPARPEGGEALVQELRHMVALANGLLHAEATELGAPSLDYRMLCDADGRVQVDTVVLPLTEGSTGQSTADFYRIVAAVRALGYDNPMAKYWIWYDDREACPCAGVADLAPDNQRSANNAANAGPYYAITFGYRGAAGAFVLMHENAHNMAAVSNLAPQTSGGGHCNDGLDIMCYSDGGAKSKYTPSACSSIHFDCNHDTYFHPRPAEGSYLDRRWNLAAPLNRFVQGCLHHEVDVVPAAAGVGMNEAWVELPEACRGARFAALAEHLAQPTQILLYTPPQTQANDVDVCWYAQETLLACHAEKAFEEGVVPLAATRALLRHVDGTNGRLLLSIV